MLASHLENVYLCRCHLTVLLSADLKLERTHYFVHFLVLDVLELEQVYSINVCLVITNREQLPSGNDLKSLPGHSDNIFGTIEQNLPPWY